MTIPYVFMNVFAGKGDPNLSGIKDMCPQKAFDHLMEKGMMKGKYLGACLDSCRIGSITTCYWKTDVDGLLGFIEKWRNENNDSDSLYHEHKIEDLYTRFELPHISHDSCQRDKSHKGIIKDSLGRLRCAHINKFKLRPNFIHSYYDYDELSQQRIANLYDDEPNNPLSWDEDGELISDKNELVKYMEKFEKYNNEKKEAFIDPCYAIISDKDLALPLETIIDRLNLQTRTKKVYCGDRLNFREISELGCKRLDQLPKNSRDYFIRNCPGHTEKNNGVEFMFDGWTLAHYVLKWKRQNGNPELKSKRIEHWNNREKFKPIYDDEL